MTSYILEEENCHDPETDIPSLDIENFEMK